MHTIKLFRYGRNWYAQFSDPAVIGIMGYGRVQTPFRRAHPADAVLAAIRELNPDCIVSLEENQS